uniref:DNA repair and recombination protein RAD5B n=1 Tax=Parastrongyloides trichosuri TaxID=131310 RepID=A0A0N4ZMK8_PARTI
MGPNNLPFNTSDNSQNSNSSFYVRIIGSPKVSSRSNDVYDSFTSNKTLENIKSKTFDTNVEIDCLFYGNEENYPLVEKDLSPATPFKSFINVNSQRHDRLIGKEESHQIIEDNDIDKNKENEGNIKNIYSTYGTLKNTKRKSPLYLFGDLLTESNKKFKVTDKKNKILGPILCSPQPMNVKKSVQKSDPFPDLSSPFLQHNLPSKYIKTEKEFESEVISNGESITLDNSSIDTLLTIDKTKRLLGGLMDEDRHNNINKKLLDFFKTLVLHNNSFDARKKIETPKNFGKELNPYQKEGLNFLVTRENSYPCGGILADDMGLGKTAQMIALIVYQKENTALNQTIETIRYRKAKENCLIPIKSTLVVAPLGLINQWESEIKKFTRNYISVYQYHGPKRISDPFLLGHYDIIISSYQTVASELSHIFDNDNEKENDGTKRVRNLSNKKFTRNINKISVLEKLNFRRIILDEAHNIKNRKSKASKACYLLSALSRWCVTGTPIHNEMMDAFSLYRFLRTYPIDQEDMWKKYMNTGTVDGPLRLKTLVKATLLRRTKDQTSEETGEPLVKLTKKHMEKIELEMSTDERFVYDQMFAAAQQFVQSFLNESSVGKNLKLTMNVKSTKNLFLNAHTEDANDNFKKMACILVFLMRLRQACNHLFLTKNGLDLDCFDVGDIKDVDMMRENLSMSQNFDGYFMDNFRENSHLQVFEETYQSSKIKVLFDRLDEILKKSNDKIIIISQWTSMLKLLHPHLKDRGVGYVQITGEVDQKIRHGAQNDINNMLGSKRVMLLSLKAGGVGLNLVGANHIFMLDLHWNPFMEDQACDRIYRIGQTKDVYIHKFVCKNTIENRVLDLQEKKRELSNQFLGENKAKNGNHLNNEDLAFLFGCK